jgi:TonB family protein
MKVFLIGLIVATISVAAAFSQTPGRVIQGGVLNGKAISLPKPTYPDEAKIAKIGGAVSIQVTIDEGGNVISAARLPRPQNTEEDPAKAEIQRLRALLEDAAEQAAIQAKFSPTMLSGNPVKVSGIIVYNFVPTNGTGIGVGSGSGNGNETGSGNGIGSISGGVLNGKAISLPHPEYPPSAAAVRAEGTVSVQVLINENGDVISARAVSGHPLLQAAAVEAARAAKFAPTRIQGKTVKVSGIITYNFVP